MNRALRNAFPYVALLVLLSALAWAVSFGTLPPADFTFDNSTEIKTVDPAIATGQPEGRVIMGLLEGLLRGEPEGEAYLQAGPNDAFPLSPKPAAAESFTISDDGLTYTFQMRPTAKWSNGDPVTADDYVFSWQRMLHPETASEYVYQLHYIAGAEAYNTLQTEIGKRVEVELNDRRSPLQLFPRGTIVRGVLREIVKPPEPEIPEGANAKKIAQLKGEWRDAWRYVVETDDIETANHLSVEAIAIDEEKIDGAVTFARKPGANAKGVVACKWVLPDFNTTVGLKAPSPNELVVTLRNPTPYFPDLVAFYPLFPVHRKTIEKFGPDWLRPENIVTNGPYSLEFRRLRDRLRLKKNEHYWDAKSITLNTIDVLAIKSDTTALNMFLNGQVDWATRAPNTLVPDIQKKMPGEFYSAPMLTIYMYVFNTTRAPLDKKEVRQALAQAINRQQIVQYVTRAGQQPAASFVPPGLRGYDPPQVMKYDPDGAAKLLEAAGFAGGRDLPKIEILHNFDQLHKEIAEVIQQQWREELGLDIGLRNLEWGVYLDTLHKKDFQVARYGWIGDYPDPNTFLDLFLTDGANNNTGWSNAEYDALVKGAAAETDPAKRMEMFVKAERILLDEVPVVPIYHDVSRNLVKPWVKGFFCDPQDMHPLTLLRVDRAAPRNGGKR